MTAAPTLPSKAERKGWKNPGLKIDNLDLLIKHMKNMPDEALNMCHWIAPISGRRYGYEPLVPYSLSHLSELPVATAMTIASTQEKQGKSGIPECGTSACIAGTAAILIRAGDRKKKPSRRMDENLGIDIATRRWLGMEPDQAEMLFHGHGHPSGGLSSITRKEAIKTLQYLRETGTVTWMVPVDWKKTYVSTMKGKPLPFLIKEADDVAA